MNFQINPLSEARQKSLVWIWRNRSTTRPSHACIKRISIIRFWSSATNILRRRNTSPLAAALATCLGTSTTSFLPGYPEILKVSNKKTADGDFAGLASAGRRWHSDLSYAETPSLGSLLYALEIPPEGGDTLFNNMYRAYDALPAATKSKIDDLKAEFLIGSARKYYTENERPSLTEAQLASVPPVEHPVVRTIRRPSERRSTSIRHTRSAFLDWMKRKPMRC